MSKRKPYIFVTQDKLIDLCRYDIGWVDTIGGSDSDAYPLQGFDVQCESEYPMLLPDLKTALGHFEEDNISFEDFLFDWWYPITTYFYEDLCLDELFGADPDMIGEYPLPPLINSDEDMIVTIFVRIAKIADSISRTARHLPHFRSPTFSTSSRTMRITRISLLKSASIPEMRCWLFLITGTTTSFSSMLLNMSFTCSRGLLMLSATSMFSKQ